MAEARLYVSQEQFRCSICLELLNNPVTIPCGHSYCMDCIRQYWDVNAHGRQYNCPQCRQSNNSRLVLGRNVVLAEMVEKLRRTELQSAPVSQIEAGPGDVECDVCTGRKYKAIKSCLVCLNSLCQSHFQQHEKAFKGETHCLIDATEELEEMICPIHKEILEIFCHTDQMSICKRCTMSNHKYHEVTSRAARMNQCGGDEEDFPTHALPAPQSSSSYLVPLGSYSFNGVSRGDYGRKSFAKRLKKKMDNFLNSEVVVVSGWVMCCNFPTDGPKNRNQILQYLHKLSMDSNTMNETLLLSRGNKEATNTGKVHLYPEHPDRFDCWPQVLCKESVFGRAYWEFEWSGRAGVGVSLAYKSICRKGNGDESKFGCNDHSMILYCSPSKYTFWDSNKKTKLHVNLSKIKTSRLGVYVDYSAGIVCFFSIADRMKLIHIVQTKFSQHIYPGFRVYCGSSVKLCDPATNCT